MISGIARAIYMVYFRPKCGKKWKTFEVYHLDHMDARDREAQLKEQGFETWIVTYDPAVIGLAQSEYASA